MAFAGRASLIIRPTTAAGSRSSSAFRLISEELGYKWNIIKKNVIIQEIGTQMGDKRTETVGLWIMFFNNLIFKKHFRRKIMKRWNIQALSV